MMACQVGKKHFIETQPCGQCSNVSHNKTLGGSRSYPDIRTNLLKCKIIIIFFLNITRSQHSVLIGCTVLVKHKNTYYLKAPKKCVQPRSGKCL